MHRGLGPIFEPPETGFSQTMPYHDTTNRPSADAAQELDEGNHVNLEKGGPMVYASPSARQFWNGSGCRSRERGPVCGPDCGPVRGSDNVSRRIYG